MEEFSLSIRLSNGDSFDIEANSMSTVMEVKEIIAKKSGLLENQQRLVYQGKILNDNLSLSFYKIVNKATIFLVPIKRSPNKHQNPKGIIEKLKNLTNEIRIAPPNKVIQLANQIRELTTNSFLLSYASINAEALQVIEEAQNEIEEAEQDMDSESTQYIAQANDITLNQIESQPDGLRTLTSILEEDLKEDAEKYDFSFDEPTVITDKPAKISDSPLPALSQSKISSTSSYYILPTGQEFKYDLSDEDFWCETDFKRYIKQKYAQQVEMLKDMGFDDEQTILQALGETGGNVLLAFQILQSRLFFQC